MQAAAPPRGTVAAWAIATESPRHVRDELLQVLPRRPALDHGAANGLPERPGPPPDLSPFLRGHDPVDSVADVGRGGHVMAPLPRAHQDAGAEVLAHELGVPGLVAVHGPRQDRLPVAEALHGGVPAAVAHERRGGAVRQDLQLRRPPGDHHASAVGAELGRRGGAEGLGTPLPAAHARAVGVPQRPHEARPAVPQRGGQLAHLLRAERRRRTERHVQHRRGRLRVEPAQALVPSPARAGEGEHRAERPDGEQPWAVGGRDPPECVEEVALERAAGVDDHAGSGRAPALLAHLPGERDELRRGAGVGRVEHEAVASQEGVPRVRPPDVVGGGEAVHAEGLGVG
uniref:Uncharacterized protein n=1 Tax=Zea mays TaxID=4577 RepID=A0A804MTQ8_MAIZE